MRGPMRLVCGSPSSVQASRTSACIQSFEESPASWIALGEDMFGSDSEKQVERVAGQIGGALNAFDTALSLTAALLRKPLPDPDDRYLAILLGFADFSGQAAGVNMDITRKALQRFLASSAPDGHQVYQRMMVLSNDRRFFEWQMLGGRALSEAGAAMKHGRDAVIGVMSKLAEIYLG